MLSTYPHREWATIRIHGFTPTLVECFGCRRAVESFAIWRHGFRFVAPMRCDDCARIGLGIEPQHPVEIAPSDRPAERREAA